MSNTNQVQLVFIAESTFGTVPSSGANQIMRFTQESLQPESSFVRSEEIVGDRQVTDRIRVDFKTSGDIGFELSWQTHDDMMEKALQSAVWTVSPTVYGPRTDISAASGDNSLNTVAGDFTTAFAAGQWIQVSGFTGSAGNNTVMRVVSVTALKMVVEGFTLVTDAAGENVTITAGAFIKNGTTQTSYAIRKYFTDVTLYEVYSGQTIDTMSLSVTVGDKISGSFGFMGKTMTVGNWANATSPTAATTGAIFQTVDHVPQLLVQGVATQFTEFTMELKNNLRGRAVVGTLGPISMGSGTSDLTGTLKLYFSSTTEMALFLANTQVRLSLRLRNSSNQNYMIDIPAVRLSAGTTTTPGQDGDVMAEFSWEAYKAPTEGYTIAMYRFSNAA